VYIITIIFTLLYRAYGDTMIESKRSYFLIKKRVTICR